MGSRILDVVVRYIIMYHLVQQHVFKAFFVLFEQYTYMNGIIESFYSPLPNPPFTAHRAQLRSRTRQHQTRLGQLSPEIIAVKLAEPCAKMCLCQFKVAFHLCLKSSWPSALLIRRVRHIYVFLSLKALRYCGHHVFAACANPKLPTPNANAAGDIIARVALHQWPIRIFVDGIFNP